MGVALLTMYKNMELIYEFYRCTSMGYSKSNENAIFEITNTETMTQVNFLHGYLKFLLLQAAFFISIVALGQTPTHIDQGASDESISIFEEPRYLFLIVALIVILVVVYVALKRRGKE